MCFLATKQMSLLAFWENWAQEPDLRYVIAGGAILLWLLLSAFFPKLFLPPKTKQALTNGRCLKRWLFHQYANYILLGLGLIFVGFQDEYLRGTYLMLIGLLLLVSICACNFKNLDQITRFVR